MITRRAFAETIGDHAIQFGLEPKESVEKRINFAESFGVEPVSVVISPYWEGARGSVGHAETIHRIERDHFVVMSNNRASNYGVSWIAVGKRQGLTVSDNVVFPFSVGDLTIAAGRLHKPRGTTVSRTFSRGTFASAVHSDYGIDVNPVVQLSPHWDAILSGVGHAETLSVVEQEPVTSSAETEHWFRAVSGNAHPNFYVHYLAAGTRFGDMHVTDEGGVSGFAVGNYLIRTGLYQKTGPVRAYGLGSPEFAMEPIVVVTPYWHTADRNVGYAETLNAVERHYFEVASGNSASNYFVSWIAIGRS